MAADFDAVLRRIAGAVPSRVQLWLAVLQQSGVRTMAEIGVFRGDFARSILQGSPAIERYYLVDPWRHLPDWNKPANTSGEAFDDIRAEALSAVVPFAGKCRELRGTTTEVIGRIPDGSLDAVYIDGDHTLRGVTIDLMCSLAKVRDGGWIGGDDFSPTIWQHPEGFEPTLVFPFAVHFAEAAGLPVYALPHGQFLIHKQPGSGFAFIDLTGRYGSTALLPQVAPRGEGDDRVRAALGPRRSLRGG